ncbi:MAG: ATP-binding cassette domain-containing protein, partial [Pseudomonadota bacterium]
MDDSAIHADGGRAAPGATPAAAPLLTVEGLSISFATPKLDREGGANLVRAVRGVSFEMRPGETLALVGESGSGKSVTALAAARLLPSAARLEGSVRYDGLEILEASEGQLREIRGAEMSYIFQEPMTSLNPLHTIEQQINETLRIHQGLDGDDARARVLSLLHQVGVRDPESRLGAYPHQLSGGQRQRVMIAMALANEPKLLIADEPTTALDVTIQAQILTLLKQLQTEKGMAMLFITHDLGVVRRIADRVAVMQHGEIVETGPTERLFEAPAHPYTQKLLAAEPRGVAKPLYRHAPELVAARGVKVWFPIKAGLLRRTVGHVKAVRHADLTLRQG